MGKHFRCTNSVWIWDIRQHKQDNLGFPQYQLCIQSSHPGTTSGTSAPSHAEPVDVPMDTGMGIRLHLQKRLQ
eukprot:12912075-Prorocentrum_lima.AAC.1